METSETNPEVRIELESGSSILRLSSTKPVDIVVESMDSQDTVMHCGDDITEPVDIVLDYPAGPPVSVLVELNKETGTVKVSADHNLNVVVTEPLKPGMDLREDLDLSLEGARIFDSHKVNPSLNRWFLLDAFTEHQRTKSTHHNPNEEIAPMSQKTPNVVIEIAEDDVINVSSDLALNVLIVDRVNLDTTVGHYSPSAFGGEGMIIPLTVAPSPDPESFKLEFDRLALEHAIDEAGDEDLTAAPAGE